MSLKRVQRYVLFAEKTNYLRFICAAEGPVCKFVCAGPVLVFVCVHTSLAHIALCARGMYYDSLLEFNVYACAALLGLLLAVINAWNIFALLGNNKINGLLQAVGKFREILAVEEYLVLLEAD